MSRASKLLLILVIPGAALALQPGCGRAPVKQHAIKQLAPVNLRVRRPAGPGADPAAGPGGTDYRSRPLPNEQLDCEKAGTLLRGLDVAGLRACFAALQAAKEPVEVLFRLRRLPQPFLELQAAETTPACLAATLPRLPVPREIVFQSADADDQLGCYSSRLDLEADEVLGFKAPKARLELRLRFPQERAPKDDEETERMLVAWALTPFWGDRPSERALPGVIVPVAICKACIGEKNLLDKRKSAPVYWP
jgi:hypothetical protein